MGEPRIQLPFTPAEWQRQRTTEAALNDLDHRITCPTCHRQYLVVGDGPERRLRPDHKPTCPRYRPPAPQKGPAPAPTAPPAEEAHPGRQRPGYIPPETRRLDPAAGATPATENDHTNATRPSVDVELARLADPAYLRTVTHDLFGPQPPKPTP